MKSSQISRLLECESDIGSEDKRRCERLTSLRARIASLRDALGSEVGAAKNLQDVSASTDSSRDLLPSVASLRHAVERYYKTICPAHVSERQRVLEQLERAEDLEEETRRLNRFLSLMHGFDLSMKPSPLGSEEEETSVYAQGSKVADQRDQRTSLHQSLEVSGRSSNTSTEFLHVFFVPKQTK
mmetsp:Transcript_49696/g.155512  ORF Transcript_49696/g.155512 Transcript_49696/m.155512 type:complete len:184 (-) Transcript_49696:901-1452(-)